MGLMYPQIHCTISMGPQVGKGSGADPGFFIGEGANPKAGVPTYDFAKISKNKYKA